jgi:hypothetical protein
MQPFGKLDTLVQKAVDAGAELVVFGESFVPSLPRSSYETGFEEGGRIGNGKGLVGSDLPNS